ncbi:hypothetical protein GCM10027285_18700 [Oleiagrimonas citrea]|uniref:GH64 domain-containing protein n=1 Tax=Oleiagrimonas citrea TaxID=1665687 RepID=A0A846ZJ34_9GAMM|nr:beta-1,3-glucanase family protein [Oleiagrimonas citrea]NKZ37812.1 hypothetical protein [Oleiagrimonas citrea]
MYTIEFSNKNTGIAEPWVTFIQATKVVGKSTELVAPKLEATAVIGGKTTALVNGKSYSLSEIGNTLQMGPENWQGHVYLSDAALTPPTSGSFPVDMAYTDTSDHVRYQYLEFAGSTSTASADITYINWYSIPLEMQSTTQQASKTRGAPRSGASLSGLPATLAALSGGNAASVVKNAEGQIVRVISPNAGNPNWLPLYPSFRDYLKSVFIDSTQQIPINNAYSGVGKSTSPDLKPQTFQTTSVTYAGQTLEIKGTTSLLGDFTMRSEMIWQTFNSVIYLAVMNYSWSYAGNGGSIPGASDANGNTGDNNVFSAVSRDLMAGFAYGFVGSEKYGAKDSSTWMQASATDVFSNIQPNQPFYNPWANAFVANFSDVYTFPFNDFLSGYAPEINVDSGDTLTVTLLGTD